MVYLLKQEKAKKKAKPDDQFQKSGSWFWCPEINSLTKQLTELLGVAFQFSRAMKPCSTRVRFPGPRFRNEHSSTQAEPRSIPWQATEALQAMVRRHISWPLAWQIVCGLLLYLQRRSPSEIEKNIVDCCQLLQKLCCKDVSTSKISSSLQRSSSQRFPPLTRTAGDFQIDTLPMLILRWWIGSVLNYVIYPCFTIPSQDPVLYTIILC